MLHFLINSGSLYSQDRILQAMGNITLAFHLLCERANPNSFWLPYIQTLPNEYDTPLYFEEDEVQYLRSTQAIHDVFSQYKNTARQYAYFYKVIQVSILNIVNSIVHLMIEKGVKTVMLNNRESVLFLEGLNYWSKFMLFFLNCCLKIHSSVGLWIYKNVFSWLREVITTLCLTLLRFLLEYCTFLGPSAQEHWQTEVSAEQS